MLRRQTLAGAASAAIGLAAGRAFGQSWPTRPIHWIVPRAPGGAIDVAGRVVAEAVATDLGQPVIIESKPGADGTIGAGIVARAAPEGYHWLLATLNHLVAPLLQPTPYHPVMDFAAAVRFGAFTSLAVVPAELPVTTMADFIAYARQRPGQLNYLNSGSGSSMHLSTELLKIRQGIDLVAVHYKGMQPAIVDLLGARIEFGFVPTSLVLHHVRAGKLRALALVGSQRLAELPDVRTLAELGLADIQIESWMMLLAPAGTPSQILDRMHRIAVAALSTAALRERLASASLDVLPPLPPAQLQQHLAAEHARFATLISDAGITAER